jgi:hypothetical protein
MKPANETPDEAAPDKGTADNAAGGGRNAQ